MPTQTTHAYIERAIKIALDMHVGQVDKSGQPYILHPLRVMTRVQARGNWGNDVLAAAVLHDTVEDSGLTLDTIGDLFGDRTAHLVDTVTRREGEDYPTFIERVCSVGGAVVAIKLADMEDNLDFVRMARLDEETRNRLMGKYLPHLATLRAQVR